MIEWFSDFFRICFTGPVWPATVLLGLLFAYGVLVLLGLADGDIDGGGLESDGSADLSDAAGSLGATTIRFVNLDAVPVFIWLSVFGLAWWLLSFVLWEVFDSQRYQPVLVTSLLVGARNLVIAVGITKLITAPMRSWFERSPAVRAEQIVGGICIVETSEATSEFGRARYRTDGAPLLLNVRTLGEKLVKGQQAQIIDFDTTTRIYTVQSLEAGK